LHLAAFGLLLGLNLVEGELQGAAGCQPRQRAPVVKQSEITLMQFGATGKAVKCRVAGHDSPYSWAGLRNQAAVCAVDTLWKARYLIKHRSRQARGCAPD
jgi:hypothetical protein